MADNFLEYHREEYERRKAEWLRRKKGLKARKIIAKATIARPDDEAL